MCDSEARRAQLVTVGVVGSISPTTIRRILTGHRLKPWRHHLWLSPKVPPDAAFAKAIRWMNQVEQWFSILQRKRLRIANES